MSFKSGFISIIGRPNAGKSTFLNYVLGEKISIISPKPQTTRNIIRGISTTETSQMIFIDTPGIHEHKGMLNEYMVKEALSYIKGVDTILYIIDGVEGVTREDKFIIESLGKSIDSVVLAVNKVDSIKKERLLPLTSHFAEDFGFKEIIPISAKTGEGIDKLLSLLESRLPEGPKYFPEDSLTDVPERFIVAEIIREKVFNKTSDEVPYSVAVAIEEFRENPKKKIITIKATINVDRDSQKGIIIGKKGAMLKGIGSEARRDIEKFLGSKVFLEIFVRVQKNWTKNTKSMKDFGYK